MKKSQLKIKGLAEGSRAEVYGLREVEVRLDAEVLKGEEYSVSESEPCEES